MNRRSIVSTTFAVGLLLLGACSACPASVPTSVTIVVQPNHVPIFAGAEQEFSASGAPGKFSWTIAPTTGGNTIRAEDTPDAFRSFVLDFLDHAEVLSPPELRDDMVRWLQEIA